jgi:hypothetical protein
VKRPSAIDVAVMPHPESLIGRLQALGEALHQVDSINPGSQPSALRTVTDRLLIAARAVTVAAGPVIEDAVTLTVALRDAAADRRDLPGWCRDCHSAYDGLCGDHQENLALAEAYDHLHGVIFEPPGTEL